MHLLDDRFWSKQQTGVAGKDESQTADSNTLNIQVRVLAEGDAHIVQILQMCSVLDVFLDSLQHVVLWEICS